MARGQRKPIEEKIREKEAVISGIKSKLQAEEKELTELKREKRSREVEQITTMLKEANISIDEAKAILEQHTASTTA